ncbi:MAG TPA: DUF1614 domain-containing protein [Bacillota bacterium]|nr:DUF1614 domain-containing protein [Bacillota bacterium]HPT87627.1 DUF1614 domain-containing protein [Bacillota bacterium]
MTGIVLLVIVSVLIFLGLAHQVLDRLYLSDKGGLLVIGAMVVGSFIDIPIWRNPQISLNVGGGIIPLALAIYVLTKAGSAKEWTRSIIGIVVTTGIIYGVSKLYKFDIHQGVIEPQYLWAIIAAIVAYVIGRSRRLAFIVSTLSLLFMDVVRIIEVSILNINSPTRIGGAGAFDTIIIAGVLAVLLAEIIGESREALQGGPSAEGKPEALREALDHPEMDRKGKGEGK